MAAIVDISRLKQAEDQQQLLLSELQHRVKNILATISSLAMRMCRGRTVAEFNSAFLSKLRAMSRTHDLLASGSWSGASLEIHSSRWRWNHTRLRIRETSSSMARKMSVGASAATTWG